MRRYLTLSTRRDLTKLRPLVAAKCYGTAVGVATATAAFGTRLEVNQVQVSLVSERRGEAKVKYTVKGSITKRDPEKPPVEEKGILGKQIKLRPPGATLRGIERSGELLLRRISGQWRIVCPKLPKVKPGVIGEKPGEPVHIPHFGPHRPGEGHDHDHEHDKRGPSVRAPGPRDRAPTKKKPAPHPGH